MAEKKPKAIVYGTEWCPWCVRAKQFFEQNKVQFEERDVGKDPAWAKELMQKSGQSGVPVIVVGKKVIVGFDERAIRAALGL